MLSSSTPIHSSSANQRSNLQRGIKNSVKLPQIALNNKIRKESLTITTTSTSTSPSLLLENAIQRHSSLQYCSTCLQEQDLINNPELLNNVNIKVNEPINLSLHTPPREMLAAIRHLQMELQTRTDGINAIQRNFTKLSQHYNQKCAEWEEIKERQRSWDLIVDRQTCIMTLMEQLWCQQAEQWWSYAWMLFEMSCKEKNEIVLWAWESVCVELLQEKIELDKFCEYCMNYYEHAILESSDFSIESYNNNDNNKINGKTDTKVTNNKITDNIIIIIKDGGNNESDVAVRENDIKKKEWTDMYSSNTEETEEEKYQHSEQEEEQSVCCTSMYVDTITEKQSYFLAAVMSHCTEWQQKFWEEYNTITNYYSELYYTIVACLGQVKKAATSAYTNAKDSKLIDTPVHVSEAATTIATATAAAAATTSSLSSRCSTTALINKEQHTERVQQITKAFCELNAMWNSTQLELQNIIRNSNDDLIRYLINNSIVRFEEKERLALREHEIDCRRCEYEIFTAFTKFEEMKVKTQKLLSKESTANKFAELVHTIYEEETNERHKLIEDEHNSWCLCTEHVSLYWQSTFRQLEENRKVTDAIQVLYEQYRVGYNKVEVLEKESFVSITNQKCVEQRELLEDQLREIISLVEKHPHEQQQQQLQEESQKELQVKKDQINAEAIPNLHKEIDEYRKQLEEREEQHHKELLCCNESAMRKWKNYFGQEYECIMELVTLESNERLNTVMNEGMERQDCLRTTEKNAVLIVNAAITNEWGIERQLLLQEIKQHMQEWQNKESELSWIATVNRYCLEIENTQRNEITHEAWNAYDKIIRNESASRYKLSDTAKHSQEQAELRYLKEELVERSRMIEKVNATMTESKKHHAAELERCELTQKRLEETIKQLHATNTALQHAAQCNDTEKLIKSVTCVINEIAAIENGSESAYCCSSCYEVMEEPVMCIPCGHCLCEVCWRKVKETTAEAVTVTVTPLGAAKNSNITANAQLHYCPECKQHNVHQVVYLRALHAIINQWRVKKGLIEQLQLLLQNAANQE